MMKSIFRTRNDFALLIARLALGIVIFPHGAQKLLGWFGGYGFGGTMGYMTGLGIPAVFALLAIVAEFFGALGLIFGFLTRVAAFGIGVVMVVAAAMAHLSAGFFIDWSGQTGAHGIEFHLLAVGLAALLTVRGAGALSADLALSEKEDQDASYEIPRQAAA
jgi:putative oxidoreductase